VNADNIKANLVHFVVEEQEFSQEHPKKDNHTLHNVRQKLTLGTRRHGRERGAWASMIAPDVIWIDYKTWKKLLKTAIWAKFAFLFQNVQKK